MTNDTPADPAPDQPEVVIGARAEGGVADGVRSSEQQLRRAGIAGLLVVALVALVAVAGFGLRGSGDDADQGAVDLQSVSTATIVFQPLDGEDDSEESGEIMVEPEGPATSIVVLTTSTLPRDPDEGGSLEVVDPNAASTTDAPKPPAQPRPTTTTTIAPLPPAPPPEPLPPLPFAPVAMQVPAELCSIASLEGDLELRFDADPRCAGPWAVVDLTAVRGATCPPELLDAEQVCRGVQILRWTTTGWQNRGVRDAQCYDSVISSGVSRTRNAELFGDNEACMARIAYRDEPASGDVRQGDLGLRVAELQIRLREAGVLTDGVDGRFGRNTRAAVIDLQYLLDLEPTGVANEAVFAALALPVR